MYARLKKLFQDENCQGAQWNDWGIGGQKAGIVGAATNGICIFIYMAILYKKIIIHQAPVFQKLDSIIHRINHYPMDKYY